MKNIVPALNKIQLNLTSQPTRESLTQLGMARKELFAAIREAIVDGMNTNDQASFLAKFDKLNAE